VKGEFNIIVLINSFYDHTHNQETVQIELLSYLSQLCVSVLPAALSVLSLCHVSVCLVFECMALFMFVFVMCSTCPAPLFSPGPGACTMNPV